MSAVAANPAQNTNDSNAISALLSDLGIPAAKVGDTEAVTLLPVVPGAAEPSMTAAGSTGEATNIDVVLAELEARDSANAAAAAPAAAKKGGKKGGKKAAAPKVEPETPATNEDQGEGMGAPAVEAKAKIPRIHFANKVDRIKHRLGDELASFLVLEISADPLTEEQESEAATAGLMILEAMNVKEKTRAGFLFDFISGKTDKLNSVMEKAVRMLVADSELTTGDSGNLHQKLLAKPYSPAAARSMGRNTINVLEKLKVITADGKQKFVPNANSLILARIKPMLGL